MKKFILLLLIILGLFLSCSDKTAEELGLIQKSYESNPSLDGAIQLAEYYNNNYNRNLQEGQMGLAVIDGLIEEYPHALLLQVLKGNLMTIQGGHYSDDQDYTKALNYVDDGFRIMDKAVKADPQNCNLLIYRAINSATVPEMFNRKRIAIEDFEILYQMGADKTGEIIYILTLYNYAELLKSQGDEIRAKELMAELEINSPAYKEKVNL